MPIERPSPGINALRDLADTLIFSRIFSFSGDWTDMGSTSLTEAFFAASSFFFLCVRSFSLLASILQGEVGCLERTDETS